jgi:hypothetical protein
MRDKHTPPNHELDLPKPDNTICSDCGTRFPVAGDLPDNLLTAQLEAVRTWCPDCYEKRTQAWDQQKDAYEESGTL